MANKDITEKLLEDYPDVFADIVNGLLFDGEQIIHPDELEDMRLRSMYKADGKIHEQERDVAKRWKKDGIRIACVGFENQSQPDKDMVLRVYGYDGAEYRSQCLKENAHQARYPVVTLVLYFGHEKRWDAPKTLYEAVSISDLFKPYVSDIKINVFEIAFLSDEQVKLFQSDFRIVADYFVQKRKTGSYTGSKDRIEHVQALLQLLSVMEQDTRFEEVYDQKEKEGGIRNMCEVLDRIEEKGIEKGIERGIERGVEITILSDIRNLKETLHLSTQQAMDALKVPKNIQEKYAALL